MRTCPACQAKYEGKESRCTRCGAALAEDEASISLSETMRESVAVGGGGGGGAAPTPAPSVRAGSSTGSGLMEIPAGRDGLVGSRLAGRYEVTRKIGEGGMGAVYEARHSLIGKRVAIKVLLDKYAQKQDVVARLQQEARLASSIGHEHIVDITDFGQTDDGRTFVVMEFLEGESLAQLLHREGPLPPARVVAIARQVVSALGAAHSKGIVHRDVKPENVFITRRASRDFAKVVDFGISKLVRPQEEDGAASDSPRLTQTGMVLGTPLYMSPEQARGEDELDQRIDVYAVGVILYELITGEVPYRGTNYLSIISQVLSQEPKRPSELRPDLGISPALEAVILKAMAKDRDHRYAGMPELDADLAALESGGEVAAATERSGRHLDPGPRRGGIHQGDRVRLVAWVAGVGAVILAVALLVPRFLGDEDGAKKAAAAAPVEPQQPTVPPPTPSQGVSLPPMRPEIETITAEVVSVPDGAEIWFGSVSQGTCPKKLQLPKGDERIELVLRMEGYEDATAPFFPTKDQKLEVRLKKASKKRPGPVKPPGGGGQTTNPDRGPTSGGEIKPDPFAK